MVVQIGMLIFFRFYNKKREEIINGGLVFGFGIGLIAQIFTGMTLFKTGSGVLFQRFGVSLPSGTFQRTGF